MSLPNSAAWWVVVVLLGATVLYTRAGGAYSAPSLDKSLQFFPLELKEWSCTPVEVNPDSYHDAYADHSWAGKCRKSGLELDVHVGYASGSSFQSRNVSPRVNHPTFGLDDRWSFIPVNIPAGPGLQSGYPGWNQILLQHSSGFRVAVLYWYQISDSVYSDDYDYRIALLIRRLLRKPAASQLIRISSNIRSEQPAVAFDPIQEFARVFAQVVRSRFARQQHGTGRSPSLRTPASIQWGRGSLKLLVREIRLPSS